MPASSDPHPAVSAELQGGRRLLRRLRAVPARAVVLHVAEVGGKLVTPPDDLSAPGAHALLLSAHGLWEIFRLSNQAGTTVFYKHQLPDPRDPRFFPFENNPRNGEGSWLAAADQQTLAALSPFEYGVIR